MSDFEKLLPSLSAGENAQILKWVVQELAEAFPGIDSRRDLCGGDACIVRTRIPVRLLDQARRLGSSEQALLEAYPSLRAEDLVNAWAYYAFPPGGDRCPNPRKRIGLVARFYTNENIPLQVATELRRLGHDVLTSFDAGRANVSVPDAEVLTYAAVEGRVLLSLNRRDFLRLHRKKDLDHAGMVLCTFDPTPTADDSATAPTSSALAPLSRNRGPPLWTQCRRPSRTALCAAQLPQRDGCGIPASILVRQRRYVSLFPDDLLLNRFRYGREVVIFA